MNRLFYYQEKFFSTNPFIRIGQWERLAVLLFFAIVSLLVGYLNLRQDRFDLAMIYMAFLTYMVTLAIPIMIYGSRGGWLHPLVFSVTYVAWIYGIGRSIGVYVNGLNFHQALSSVPIPILNAIVVKALLLMTLALLCMYLGFLSLQHVQMPRIRTPKPRNIPIKIVLIAGISILSLLVMVRYAGGIGGLLLQRGLADEDRIQAELGGSHWQFLAKILTPACLVWLSVEPISIRRPLFWVMFLTSLLIGFAATGSRSGILQPVIIVIALWCLGRQRVPYGRLLLVAILALGLIGGLGAFREASRDVRSIYELKIDTGFVTALADGVRTMAERGAEANGLYAVLGRVSEDVRPLLGESYLAIPAAPIPRAAWPDKPYAGGKLNALYVFERRDTSIPPGSVGEAYLNFEVLGVIVIFLLWGVFLKLLASFYSLNYRDGGARAFYILTIFTLQPNTTAAYDWMHMLAVLSFCLLFFCGIPNVVQGRVERRSPQKPVHGY